MRRPDLDDELQSGGEDAVRARADAAERFVPENGAATKSTITASDIDQDDPAFQRAAQIGAASWQAPIDGKPLPPTAFETMASKIVLEAYIPKDPKTIPVREFIYGTHLIRGFVSVTVAPSKVGKTSLKMTEALAMITGLPLLGIKPPRPLNVFFWNGEDPKTELERKFEATRHFFGITEEDILGKIFLHSGRDMEIKTAIAVRAGRGFEMAVPVQNALISQFMANEIDAAIIDPFISSHSVPENDNGAIDAVATQWADLCDTCRCGTDLIHHLRKSGGTSDRTIEDSRGAGALIAKSRSAQLLQKGIATELSELGISEDEVWRFIRIADAQSNLAPPASKATWYKLETIDLNNGNEKSKSDLVGVATLWKKPGLFDDISKATIDALMRRIGEGAYRESSQANDWIGHLVAEELDVNVADKAGKARVQRMLDEWRKSGALRRELMKDAKGNERPFIVLGNWEFSTSDRRKNGQQDG